MLLVSMLASARCSPSVHVEALSSDEPILADFFWTTRDESEAFAIAFLTIVFQLILEQLLLMVLEVAPAETSGI